ncbi:MAG: SDR family oxidoreductase [Armatimonadota bacterium]
MEQTGIDRWRLDGRTALVTGGTKGIGLAIVRELRRLGATVATVARNPPAEPEGDFHIVGDLSRPEEASHVVEQAADRLGRIDILVNNAGTNVRRPSVPYPDDAYDLLFATNLRTPWALARAAHPWLARSGQGAIVQVGSVAGTGYVGSGAPYAMTKAALDQLTRYLAVEWATDGIRVNSVNPWYTRTPLAQPILEDPDWSSRILAATPNRRIADPEDVAATVAFLCLPAARHVSGTCIAVDGGFLARAL